MIVTIPIDAHTPIFYVKEIDTGKKAQCLHLTTNFHISIAAFKMFQRSFDHLLPTNPAKEFSLLFSSLSIIASMILSSTDIHFAVAILRKVIESNDSHWKLRC